MTELLHTQLLSKFSCLGDRCEDTCCKGWSMQVDATTLQRYRTSAPELLDAVEEAVEASTIMRKDPTTSMCVKLEGGWCGIQKKYGSDYLGDACFLYPRVVRSLGDQPVMTAVMSCPEVVRLALTDDDAGSFIPTTATRLPQGMKNYLPADISLEDALKIHAAFLRVVDDATMSIEQVFLRIANVSRALDLIERKDWPAAINFYLSNNDAWMAPARPAVADPFNLVHALCGLIVALKKPVNPRMMETIGEMEKALHVKLDWDAVQIQTSDESLPAYRALHAQWKNIAAPAYEPLLRRWLKMQLSLMLHPFAGLGETLPDRMAILGVRLATVRLAFMCACAVHGLQLTEEVIVRIVQSLSRFMDHLADPAFSLQIYSETGWIHEDRMRGLLD